MKFCRSLLWGLLAILFFSPLVLFTRADRAGAQNAAPTPQPTRMPLDLQMQMGRNEQAAIRASQMSAQVAPVRGVAGDGWADVIIGQPGFGQITPDEVVGNRLFNPGGVYVDRSAMPNRLYVYDAGNSRILGYSSLGVCASGSSAGRACTSQSDCPGSSCSLDEHKRADVILGQSASYRSTCNGDSAFQGYPALPAPTAATLCGLRPESISILEGGSMATLASDPDGNLYHPDYFNNRILRYNNPFSNDAVADFEWGQADFQSGACNRGRSFGYPDNQSLCLAAPLQVGSLKSGVAVDSSRNLWVTDTQNNRVLRFPYLASRGAPAPMADLVLGQAGFTTASSGSGLRQMNHPGSIRVNAAGIVYVLDGIDGWATDGRLLVFKPPFANGMAASQVFAGLREPTGLELDAAGNLWINASDQDRVQKLVNGVFQTVFTGTGGSQQGGLGVDRDGNVYLTGWPSQEVLVYAAPRYSQSATLLRAVAYGAFNALGPRGMTDATGLEVTADQLIVADQSRLLFWNNPSQLTNNYPPASGVVGQPDFFTRPRWDPVYSRMRADTHGRLWIVRGQNGMSPELLAYQLPLVTGARPALQVSSPLPVLGGGTFSWSTDLVLTGMAYQPGCDCLWLSDRGYNRAFRIRNVSSAKPQVDIVLGQKRDPATLEIGTHCNQGRDSDDGYIHPSYPTQDSLCHPGGLALDNRGDLLLADHNLEVAGNGRMLEYDAARLPLSPATALFDVPASRVYGRGGSFTQADCLSGDPLCGPWEPVLDPNLQLTVGFNTYMGSAFPRLYENILVNSLPVTALQDFFSHAFSARYDPSGNLYALDLTRHRVLIYLAAPIMISGNVGAPNVTLIYTDGIQKTAVADSNGDYSFRVRSGWSGTVTPSGTGQSFSPVSIAYSNLSSSQTGQDYRASAAPVIAGNAGVGAATLSYVDGTTKTVVADAAGNYALTVCDNWSGSVTVSKPGYAVVPGSLSYSNVISNQMAQNYTAYPLQSVILRSMPASDGWIVESGEFTKVGGSPNSSTTTLRLGDQAAGQQYRSIVSFRTGTELPDHAVIAGVRFYLHRQSVSGGGNPFNIFQGLFVEVRRGFFGSSGALEARDFQSNPIRVTVGPYKPVPAGTLYTIDLPKKAWPYINKVGLTQMRLRFKLDDNNNSIANFISFYSGNYPVVPYRPTLVISYYVP